MFHLLNDAAAFQFERALFDCAGQDDFQLLVIDGEKKELVRSRLAGFQGSRALIAAREGSEDHIVANSANLLQDLEAVCEPFADGFQTEKNRVNIVSLDDGFDFVFRGREGRAKFSAEMLSDFGEDVRVIGYDGERIPFGVGTGFGQK